MTRRPKELLEHALRETFADEGGNAIELTLFKGLDNTEIIALEGTLEAGVGSRPATEIEDAFRLVLEQGRERDRAASRALEGPHLSDLIVTHGPKNAPAAHCSSGEQKALLIGLVLAKAELIREVSGVSPLVLLDEVAAHLDQAMQRLNEI